MNKALIYKIPFLAFVLGFVFFIPFLAFAQTMPNTGSYTLPSIWNPLDLGDPLLVCTGAPVAAPPGFVGPVQQTLCHSLCDLIYQVLWIVYLAIIWVLWAVAPISFIAGGIMYMLAGANPSMESNAKSIMKGAVIGVAIVLCSWLIINTVVKFFGITGIGGFGSPICHSS